MIKRGTGRQDLPHSLDSERAVLGALLVSEKSLPQIADWLAPNDFYAKHHQIVFQAVLDLAGQNKPYDAVTLGEWFYSEGLADIIGDYGEDAAAFVLRLANDIPSAANVVAHAEIIAEKSRLRMAASVGAELSAEACAPKAEAGLIIASASHKLSQLQGTAQRGGLISAKASVREFYAQLNELYSRGSGITGLPTPWHDLNAATHGLQDSELAVLAGRPNMGKSIGGDSMAIFTALRFADPDCGEDSQALLFSLETTRAKIIRRGVSRLASVPHDWLVSPKKDGQDDAYWPRITDAMVALSKAPLLIDETPALTVQQIVARARRAHLQKRVRLVVIDHMHIIRLPGKNRVQELGEVSRSLKALAKELCCPVLALGQLNRAVAKQGDKSPTMADLRDSGEIEQDADLILLLHREDYYDRDTHMKGVVQMEVGKGRDVPTGHRIFLQNEYQYMRMSDWTGPLPEQPRPAAAPPRSGWGSKPSHRRDS